jgi:hypothetical protein
MGSDTRTAREILQDLAGSDIRTMTGRPNRVLRVSGDCVLVGTTRSPQGQWVDIADVQAALDTLRGRGHVEISVREVGYRSAFIGAVLSTLPGTKKMLSPRRIELIK